MNQKVIIILYSILIVVNFLVLGELVDDTNRIVCLIAIYHGMINGAFLLYLMQKIYRKK